jgi:lysophospholipase L1-like esterase
MSKKYFKLIFINFIVFFAVFLTVELLARLYANEVNLAGTSSDIFEENRFQSTLGFLPNATGFSFGKSVITDNNGFIKLTCTNYDEKKKSVLFIGDSVTQGVGVESDSSFVGKLSCHYQATHNIINAALIGYDFFDYKNVVTTILDEAKLNINQVIVNYCLNDIYDKKTTSPRVSTKNIAGKFLSYMKSNSYLYIWLKGTFMDRSRAYFLHDFALYKEPSKVENLVQQITSVKKKCDQKEIDWSVVIYPYEYQIREKKALYFLPQKKVDSLLSVANTSMFSPYSFLENSLHTHTHTHTDLYLFGDGIHFSNKGHQLIFDFFLKENLIQ